MIGGDPYAAAGYDVLKVETHLHTVHSDGRDSVRGMLEACRDAGYDAVAVTDHNTVSGLTEARASADELGLILIPGVEITTFQGHAVVLGLDYVPEWRDLERRGMDALADEVRAAGGVLSVAHPAALGSPICSGCAWEWPIDPTRIDLWEVFNAGRPYPDVPTQLWRRLLATGSTAAPCAAGDVHSVSAARDPRPSTYVYVRERTASAILEALRYGRLFSSNGTRLDFWLDHTDGSTTLVGSASDARFAAKGREITPRVSFDAAMVRELAVADGRRCIYAELRSPDGRLEAISAPIRIDSST